MFIAKLLDLYVMVVFASVILSWTPLGPDHPVVKFINSAVDPVLKPIRKILPNTGGIDFSPLVLLLGLQLLKRSLF